jgi:hypothetical protein
MPLTQRLRCLLQARDKIGAARKYIRRNPYPLRFKYIWRRQQSVIERVESWLSPGVEPLFNQIYEPVRNFHLDPDQGMSNQESRKRSPNRIPRSDRGTQSEPPSQHTFGLSDRFLAEQERLYAGDGGDRAGGGALFRTPLERSNITRVTMSSRTGHMDVPF